ncbi:hypothetical protein NliqN6_1730 [Naganishia liquefaciens]|uniref:Uncharacterized protein n=1 Tax=Naganishia liquefaciens TaxID=104408 RepID=A0A8H3YDL1_9TREE|nr:hypothetical protein NliqN6_1730 [Naganishia liquefaciens]
MSKAHALTNQGTLLMNRVTGTGNKSDPVILQQALDAFEQGTHLFEQASKDIKDHGAITAVNLLIIQNRKQVKDITRRLNLLKIQERQRQLNSARAQAVPYSSQSRGLINGKTSQDDGARAEEREGKTQNDMTPGTAALRDGHLAGITEADKRPRRRRVNPGSSVTGSGIFVSTPQSGIFVSTYAKQEPAHHFSTLPASSPFGSSSTAQRISGENSENFPGQTFVDETKSLGQSPDDRLSRGTRGNSTGNSTSASSVYDGSTYASGYGYSQSSRSSGSSTFGAFDGEDGFVYFTHPLGSSDPFARFWNVLETAIDQISNPVAFASLPVDLPRVVDPVHEAIVKKQRRRHKEKHSSGKHRDKEGIKERRDRRHSRRMKGEASLSDLSGSDSFCIISKDGIHDAVSTSSGQTFNAEMAYPPDSQLHANLAGNASDLPGSGKSREELAVENLSLRHSLDVLSVQSQALQKELETYKRQADQRQEMMKSVVLGVKREAQKAMIHSQVLGSVYHDINDKEGDRSSMSNSRIGSPIRRMGHLNLDRGGSSPERRVKIPVISVEEDPFDMDSEHGDVSQQTIRRDGFEGEGDARAAITDMDTLRQRLQDVEAENRELRLEIQRSGAHLQKYRDRFERMKVSSRAKKEAKLSTGGIQRTSELPTLGEEGE